MHQCWIKFHKLDNEIEFFVEKIFGETSSTRDYLEKIVQLCMNDHELHEPITNNEIILILSYMRNMSSVFDKKLKIQSSKFEFIDNLLRDLDKTENLMKTFFAISFENLIFGVFITFPTFLPRKIIHVICIC